MDLALSNSFQREIASLVINDRVFASRFFSTILSDKDLKKHRINIFSSPLLSQIINIQKDLFVELQGIMPTKGVYENTVLGMETNESNKDNILKEYEQLSNMKLETTELHRKALDELLVIAKSTTFVNNFYSTFESPNKKNLLSLADKCRNFAEQIDRLSNSDDDEVDMTDFLELIKMYADNSVSNVRFNIPELCDELNGGGETGGLAKQEVTAWLAATNDGKSMLMVSILCDAIRNGENVLYYALEGKKLQAPLRIISNLSEIKYKKIVRFREYINKNEYAKLANYFTEEELGRLKKAQGLYAEKFNIVHAIKNCEIEKIEADIKQKFKSKYYGMVMIDYGQLIESVAPFGNTDLLLTHVFRKLEKIASSLNTAVQVPMQTNRQGMSSLKEAEEKGEEFPTYKMSQVAGGYSALKTTGCVIVLSRTEQERNEGKIRLSIAKQREGLVGVHIGIEADFAHCNLTRGKRYLVDIPGGNTKDTQLTSSLEGFGIDSDTNKIVKKVNDINILKEVSKYEDNEDLNKLVSKIKSIHGKSTYLGQLKEELDLLKYEDEDQEKINMVEGNIAEAEDQLLEAKYADEEIEALFMSVFGDKETIGDLIFGLEKLDSINEIKDEFPVLYKAASIIALGKELEILNEYR